MTRPEIRKHIYDIEALEGLEEHVAQVARKAVTASTRLDEAYEKLAQERDDLQAEVARLDSVNQDQASTIRELQTRLDNEQKHRLPRIITADELRELQWAAIPDGAPWIAGKVTLINDGWVHLEAGRRGDVYDFKLEHLSTIVLLEDAPETEVTAEVILNSEPGQCFQDRHEDDWEWDGGQLRLHGAGVGQLPVYASYVGECTWSTVDGQNAFQCEQILAWKPAKIETLP